MIIAIYRLKKSIKAAHEKIHGSLFYPKKVDFLIASIKIKNEWTSTLAKYLPTQSLNEIGSIIPRSLFEHNKNKKEIVRYV